MICSYEEALSFYSTLKQEYKSPTLHPTYVVIDSYRQMDLTPMFFFFENDGNKYYFPFHLGNYREIKDIQSPYGYNGPISTTNDEVFLSMAEKELKDWCLKNNILAGFFRFHPCLENHRYFFGKVIKNRQIVLMDLTVDDLMASYRTRVRTSIKKAINCGVTVNIYTQCIFDNAIWDKIYKLYISLMEHLEADQFYHFNEYYFRYLVEWEQSFTCTAWLNDELIGFSIFIWDGYEIHYHLSASTIEGKKLNVSSLLLHTAAEHAKNNGMKRMILGGGVSSSPTDKLLFYKKGFSKILRDYYIGGSIFDSCRYEQLKKEFEAKGMCSSKVLFYREEL